jgi:hypothetical protein
MNPLYSFGTSEKYWMRADDTKAPVLAAKTAA